MAIIKTILHRDNTVAIVEPAPAYINTDQIRNITIEDYNTKRSLVVYSKGGATLMVVIVHDIVGDAGKHQYFHDFVKQLNNVKDKSMVQDFELAKFGEQVIYAVRG